MRAAAANSACAPGQTDLEAPPDRPYRTGPRPCRTPDRTHSTGGPPRRRCCWERGGTPKGAVSRCGSGPDAVSPCTCGRPRVLPWTQTAPPRCCLPRSYARVPVPDFRYCPMPPPGFCPIWSCCAAVGSHPTGCTLWSRLPWSPQEHGPCPSAPGRTAGNPAAPRVVDCRGARHRIAPVDGVLVALDHDPVELRREELLAALTGMPLPCLQVIDATHRSPDWITDVREQLAHGDSAGALARVESVLGAGARLRDGDLRDALLEAARQRVGHGLFRAGLTGPGPGREPPVPPSRPATHRTRPRHAAAR